MEAIRGFLENVKQGGKQSHQNMTLFHLLASDAGEPDCLILFFEKRPMEKARIFNANNIPEKRYFCNSDENGKRARQNSLLQASME